MKQQFTLSQLSAMIDHTNVHPDITEEELSNLCSEAIAYGFAMVAINSAPTKYCHNRLVGTPIHVGAAISFPLGQTTIANKVFETEDAIDCGADEIDYVINITEAKAGNWRYLESEMQAINDACKRGGLKYGKTIICKVILECALLTDEEIIELCHIASRVKPTFIKTSTGVNTTGATVHDVQLMREHVSADVHVKASGGIRDAQTVIEMISHGAERIGTSSGIKIINEFKDLMEQLDTDVVEIEVPEICQ